MTVTLGHDRRIPLRDTDANGLTLEDWRGSTIISSAAVPVRRVPARGRTPDPLHLRSRPAHLAEERRRAEQIVASARGVVTSTFTDIRFGRRLNTADLEPVVAAIAASVARSPTALPSVTRFREHHEYTYYHSIAVCGLMIGLARELGLDGQLTREIGLAGLLHDVGKARVPVEILDKAGPLDLDEYAVIQQHTTRGHDLLRTSGIESEIALDVCLHHHERMDGGGYPTGVSAQILTLFARMGAVCDVYDAITSARSYKKAWSPGAALEWMGSAIGQFDPSVLRSFRKMLGIFPIGSLVRLSTQRLGVVVNEPADDPSSPDVCVFMYADLTKTLPLSVVGTRHDPIIGIELPERWNLKDWHVRREAMLTEHGQLGTQSKG